MFARVRKPKCFDEYFEREYLNFDEAESRLVIQDLAEYDERFKRLVDNVNSIEPYTLFYMARKVYLIYNEYLRKSLALAYVEDCENNKNDVLNVQEVLANKVDTLYDQQRLFGKSCTLDELKQYFDEYPYFKQVVTEEFSEQRVLNDWKEYNMHLKEFLSKMVKKEQNSRRNLNSLINFVGQKEENQSFEDHPSVFF